MLTAPLYDSRREAGFTMIEVLVTIVVLSLGLLGLAGIQAVGLRNNQTAYYRSIATQQALDMADRLHANIAGFQAGSYDNLSATTPVAATDCATATCTSATMATWDHAQWNTANGQLLPGGVGRLFRCADGSLLMRVMWIERDLLGQDQVCNALATCAGLADDRVTGRRCFNSRILP